ncbi:zinc finger protein 292 isoform X2 [Hyperolius riggenbachi]|uniref:zinc finger protein 292 isoform X2 n=1 Tax=Hyperolius riggenbachi TaxID=752182 RepID=UPI0035A2A641
MRLICTIAYGDDPETHERTEKPTPHTLLEFAEKWKASEDSLPLLEVYMVAIQSYSKARTYLTSQCENVGLVLERLALSCVELLLCLPQELPGDHWQKFQSSIKAAHEQLTENGSHELSLLYNMSQEAGVWADPSLVGILTNQIEDCCQVEDFLFLEGPLLLEMRIKRLLKLSRVAEATFLAKICSDHTEMNTKGHFKQLYLKCLCAASPNIKLIEEIARVDCKDALEMICNLESEGDEKTSLILCAAFLSRQLQFGEMYCAWELTLFWSKLQRRVEPSIQVYLEICRQLSQLTKTVYHIFFLIKVIQSETEAAGLPTCIELCVRALRLESSENAKVKISICKTISCLLPEDLEVKRACQLTEFLLEPTVDAYYAVEMLYNQPDQKYDEESLPVPNSLRCELLLVLKTRWPFDPEFWDWKTLKRQCLALMGEQASIVSSIDELNDNEAYDQMEDYQELAKDATINGLDSFMDSSPVHEFKYEKQKKKDIKKMREPGYVSARFRNWQAYMQYCVLCDKEFLGHRIIRHAQKHCIDGIYSCPICAKQYTTKESFVPHVTLHVKQSCKERLETMKPVKRLPKLPKKEPSCKPKKTETVTKQERQVKKNTLYSEDFIVFNDNDNSDENDDKDPSGNFQPGKPVNEFPCPVQFCNKGFKYFKNLIAHVRGHKDSEEATRFLEIQSKKVICQYCRRQFVSLTHLNDHLQMHCGSQPYICIQMKCKASFESYTDLLAHRKEHRHFKARCMFPNCGRVFSAAYMLFDHEAQHYNTFTCKRPGCGKIFHSQLQLEQHLSEHSTENELPESPKSKMINEVKIKEEDTQFEESFLPVANMNNTIKEESLQSASIQCSMVSKDPVVPETSLLSQKMSAIASCDMPDSKNLLDQLISAPANVPPSQNLLNQVLGSPAIERNILSKADMLAPSAFPGNSGNGRVSSLGEGFHDMLSQNNLLPAENKENASEAQRMAHTGFEVQSLGLFQDGKKCQDNTSKDQIGAVNITECKTEVQEAVSSMPFNVHHQTGHLCGNNLVVPPFEESSKTGNLLPLSLETSNALASALPSVCKASATPLTPGPPERFKCNVDGCTRIYNSVQSIGKHMKSTHPDHYPSFKTERKNRKKLKPGASLPPSNEKSTYTMILGPDVPNTFPLQSHIQSTPSHSFCNQLQHLPNSVFPTHLENLVNPLLNPVETVLSRGLSKNVAETLLTSDVGSLNNATMSSQIEDLAKVLPMKFENGSDPFLPMPTENDPLPVMSSLSGNTMFAQLGSNTDHALTGSDAANSVFIKDVDAFSKADGADMDASFNLEKSSSMLSNSGDKNTTPGRPARNKEKKVKHSPRAKFPAIIRDGKFICSRCFRAFDNPRSLGGHLSKRTVCKPHNDYGISPLIPERERQSSVLASMIMSSSPEKKIQSPLPGPQTFNTEITVKQEYFDPCTHPERETTEYMNAGFSHPTISSLGPSKKKAERFVKQRYEDTENVSNRQLPHTVDCVPSTLPLDLSDPSNIAQMHAMKASSSLTDIQGLRAISVDCSTRIPISGEGHLKTANDLCPNSMLNSVSESNAPKPVSSTRVSVISGPRSSCITTTKKKSSSSKKKKKADMPVSTEATHDLAKNILAAVGGNLQMSMNMQPNLMTYGSELLENIAKHLSNADKELFMACINESIKASPETQELNQLGVKEEKSQPPILPPIQPPYMPDNKDTDPLDVQQDLREKTFNNFSPDASEVCCINSNSLPQNKATVNESLDDEIPGIAHSVMSASTSSSPLNKMNIPVCSVSPTQESTVTYDDQVSEIMDLVEKLQIVDIVIPESLPTEEKCTQSEPVSIMSSVIVPNPSHSLVPEQPPEVASPVADKNTAKPFICQEDGCTYCAMTKDALLKHYTKVHYYTEEKLGEIKKHQLKFAPFKCVVPSCTKTFTRNSNLRAHCQSMHNFTSEQMVKLKIKRPYGKKSTGECNDFLPPEIPNGNPESKKCSEPYETVPRIKKEETEVYHEFTPGKLVASPKVEELRKPAVLSTEKLKLLSVDQKGKRGPKIKKKRKEKEIKRKRVAQKEVKVPKGPTSYKPYQCVHKGCTAAFTIQQNLMLHYQAVHKSESSKFSVDEELKNEQKDGDNGMGLNEFRCTETDCSRIFASFANLIQHYVKLHEMIAEEIENILSSVSVGKFDCDQNQCETTFTTCSSYIEHLEEVHGLKMKQTKVEGEEMYQCDIDDCDRVYATRSNLLRHIYHKHKDKHKERLIRPRKLTVGDQDSTDEKAQKEKSKIIKQKCDPLRKIMMIKRPKGTKLGKIIKGKPGKIKAGPAVIKYGRHTFPLKEKAAALAECPDSNIRQYPCLICGCTAIVNSEHNIVRHYKTHKMSKAFILRHKKVLVVCKRRGRVKVRVPSSPGVEPAVAHTKPDIIETPVLPTETQQKQSNLCSFESGDESTISTSQQSENEKDEMDELTELFISKLSNEDSTSSESHARTLSCVSSDFQETSSCQSEPQRIAGVKRTNKQKHTTPNRKKKVATPDTLSAESSSTLSCDENIVPDPSTDNTPAFDLSSFKPMGFEMSFLKFIEESVVKEKTTVEKSHTNINTKAEEQQPSEKRPRLSEDEDSDIYLLFANPSQLPNSDNIKIVLDEAFNDYIENVVKQLNELKPVVLLKKHRILRSEPACIETEQNIDVDSKATL